MRYNCSLITVQTVPENSQNSAVSHARDSHSFNCKCSIPSSYLLLIVHDLPGGPSGNRDASPARHRRPHWPWRRCHSGPTAQEGLKRRGSKPLKFGVSTRHLWSGSCRTQVGFFPRCSTRFVGSARGIFVAQRYQVERTLRNRRRGRIG